MGNLFRKEVLAAKQQRLDGSIVLAHPPSFYRLAIFVFAFVLISVVFLATGTYTKKENVNGLLQLNKGMLKIRAPQSGSVARLFVQEGQEVKKGQPLAHIVSQKHSVGGQELNTALLREYQLQISDLKKQIERTKDQQILELKKLSDEKRNLIRQIENLSAQTDIIQQRQALNQEIVSQIGELSGSGYISELEVKRQQDTKLSLDQQVKAQSTQTLVLNNELAQLEYQLAQTPIRFKSELSQLSKRLSDAQISLAQAQQSQLGEIRAPSDGIVTGVMIKPDHSVDSGQNLLSIMPDSSELRAELYVPTAAFGFVEKGQNVRIRYHAFPYERFGLYEGVITEISANVLLPAETPIPTKLQEPSYRVIVSLQQNDVIAYGKSMPLRPGMTLDADLITQERSLLRWLFDPIYSIQGRI